jgi:benzil reductase ((S)-benzoin forming)
MIQIFITGTSRGIGQALANQLLKLGHLVVGIGRTHTIAHENYQAIEADLSDAESLKKAENWFQPNALAEKIVLVNNAGQLGNINYVGNQLATDLIKTYTLNLIAPAVLSNAFIKQFSNQNKTIINISSGAAWNAYDGWSAYCATKAGLVMLGKTIKKENQINKRKLVVFNISPGIIETEMQVQIRNAQESQFSMLDKFKSLHEEQSLKTPEQLSNELLPYILGKVKSKKLYVRL